MFRIIYGFVGNKYANFKKFPISIKNQIAFIKHFFKKDKIHTGHNPPASVVMLGVFIVGLLCSISGFYSVENSLNLSEDFLEEEHEILANLFLVLVGIFTDLIFHSKTKTLQSIFTKYKSVEAENTKQNVFQTIFSVL